MVSIEGKQIVYLNLQTRHFNNDLVSIKSSYNFILSDLYVFSYYDYDLQPVYTKTQTNCVIW